MSGLVKNLTNYQVGNGDNGYGLPNLPGLNDNYGGKFYPDQMSAGNAAVAQDAGNINMTGIGNMARGAYGAERQVGGGFDGSIPAVAGAQPTPEPEVKHPSFADAIRQGGANIQNQGLSRGGKLMAVLGSVAQGALAGSAGKSFGQGALIAGQQQQQQEERRLNAIEHARQVARQQQQDELENQFKRSQMAHYEAETKKLGQPESDLRTVGNEIVQIGPGGQAHPIYQGKGKEVDDESTFAGRQRIVAANPDRFKNPKEADRYIKYGNRADININTGGEKPATRAQKAKAERDKSVALARAEQDYRDPTKGDIYGNAQELERRKRQIQDDYESQVVALGGSVAGPRESGAPPKGARVRDYTQF